MLINLIFSSFLTAYKSSSDSSSFAMWFIIIVIAIIILLLIVFTIKEKIWDEPHKEINSLKCTNNSLQNELNNLAIKFTKLLNLPDKTMILNSSTKHNISTFIDTIENYTPEEISKLLELSNILENMEEFNLNKKVLLKSIDKFSYYNKDEIYNILKLSEIIELIKENNLGSFIVSKELTTLCSFNKREIKKLLNYLDSSENLNKDKSEILKCDHNKEEINRLKNKNNELQKNYNFLTERLKSLENPEKEIKRLKNVNNSLQNNILLLSKKIKSLESTLEDKFSNFTELFDLIEISTLNNCKSKISIMAKVINLLSQQNNYERAKEIIFLNNRISFLESAQSNLTAIPYMSQIIADYETYGLEHLAKELDWGYNNERRKKVKSIREIRKDAKAMVEKNKESQYQLAYLLELFPALQDIIECEYKQLPVIKVEELTEYDASRDYLSKEEYQKLSVTERNQLALDRYKNSHNKSKWQIGRDYELYIGYQCSLKGYNVDYFGSYMGLEDLGRDLIAKKDGKILIIQCKYWSSKKLIHEKHITQLYGTMMSYCIENNCKKSDVSGVLVTNIALSDMAKTMAEFLKIKYKENVEAGDYPCIKCNINHNDSGETKIYHLPFDQKYDATKIDKKGEFYATTVAEAEAAGFRRAFKWFGS